MRKILLFVVGIEDAAELPGYIGRVLLADAAPGFVLVSEKLEDLLYFSIQTLIAAYATAIMFVDEKVTE